MKFAALSTALAVLAAFVAPAAAAPVDKRDVWVPPVLYPHAGTVWYHGQTHNVTWDTTGAPAHISNGFFILLRFNEITTPLILAQNFDPRKGRVEVTVPLVQPGSNYSIVLFGDSGNWSPQFQILQ